MVDNGWISTLTVNKFYILEPRLEDINILDIAHSLSLQCRFGGHSSKFYSVAEHSILVAKYLMTKVEKVSKVTVLAGLLHDAEEAYLPDIPKPVKELMPEAQRFYATISLAIITKYGLDDAEWPLVHAVDNGLRETEAKALGLWNEDWQKENEIPALIQGLEPIVAERKFLQQYRLLTIKSEAK